MKPADYTPLSALLFAEVCAEAGLPPGVVNVVTGAGGTGAKVAAHPLIDKLAFTGSTGVGRILRRVTAGTGTDRFIILFLGGWGWVERGAAAFAPVMSAVVSCLYFFLGGEGLVDVKSVVAGWLVWSIVCLRRGKGV